MRPKRNAVAVFEKQKKGNKIIFDKSCEVRIRSQSDMIRYRCVSRILERNYNVSSLRREHVYVVARNEDGDIVGVTEIVSGNDQNAVFYFTDVLAFAEKTGAESIILVHNHPRRTLEPSKEDNQTSQFLYNYLLINGIKLEAHVVIAGSKSLVIWEDGEECCYVE
jgi:DNA repair protein RadC